MSGCFHVIGQSVCFHVIGQSACFHVIGQFANCSPVIGQSACSHVIGQSTCSHMIGQSANCSPLIGQSVYMLSCDILCIHRRQKYTHTSTYVHVCIAVWVCGMQRMFRNMRGFLSASQLYHGNNFHSYI